MQTCFAEVDSFCGADASGKCCTKGMNMAQLQKGAIQSCQSLETHQNAIAIVVNSSWAWSLSRVTVTGSCAAAAAAASAVAVAVTAAATISP